MALQIAILNDKRTIETLRVIDKHCLAVKYADSYYKALEDTSLNALSHTASIDGVIVGSITSRLQECPELGTVCYIMTLCVLEPYRRKGIATRLVDAVVKHVRDSTKANAIQLHAQVGSDVQHFYEKQKFEQFKQVPNYYTGITPTCDAHVLALRIRRD